MIYQDMQTVLQRYHPDVLSIEKLYFTNNKTTGIDVAQARGVILLSATQTNMQVYEYTPMQVKQSVVGYGKAEKKQVMEMTRCVCHRCQNRMIRRMHWHWQSAMPIVRAADWIIRQGINSN